MLLAVWQFSAMLLAVETNRSVYQVVPTFGGSVVILMPTCRMEIGNSGCGLLLSHSLKSGWGSSTCSCSTSLSSCGIQLSDKWQLAKNTQLPWKQAIINCQDDWPILVTQLNTPCRGPFISEELYLLFTPSSQHGCGGFLVHECCRSYP